MKKSKATKALTSARSPILDYRPRTFPADRLQCLPAHSQSASPANSPPLPSLYFYFYVLPLQPHQLLCSPYPKICGPATTFLPIINLDTLGWSIHELCCSRPDCLIFWPFHCTLPSIWALPHSKGGSQVKYYNEALPE